LFTNPHNSQYIALRIIMSVASIASVGAKCLYIDIYIIAAVLIAVFTYMISRGEKLHTTLHFGISEIHAEIQKLVTKHELLETKQEELTEKHEALHREITNINLKMESLRIVTIRKIDKNERETADRFKDMNGKFKTLIETINRSKIESDEHVRNQSCLIAALRYDFTNTKHETESDVESMQISIDASTQAHRSTVDTQIQRIQEDTTELIGKHRTRIDDEMCVVVKTSADNIAWFKEEMNAKIDDILGNVSQTKLELEEYRQKFELFSNPPVTLFDN